MAPESAQLDPDLLAQWHADHAVRLKVFLFGVLKDASKAEEVCQTTFTKALTHGGSVTAGKEKAWLFQVAFNEALAIKRKIGVHERAIRNLPNQTDDPFPFEDDLIKAETADRVRNALQQLPATQQQIIELRIHEDNTFQEIADQLNVPLGTVLTRMRSALQALREALKNE